MISKKEIKSAAKELAARTRRAGKQAAERLVAAGDIALVEAGQAARQRQLQRSAKSALKVAGKVAAVAGATAATAALVGVAVRRSRKRAKLLG